MGLLAFAMQKEFLFFAKHYSSYLTVTAVVMGSNLAQGFTEMTCPGMTLWLKVIQSPYFDLPSQRVTYLYMCANPNLS